MAGYVLTFRNDAMTHLENPIWKLNVSITKHEDINGGEEEDIEIGYAEVTIVDAQNLDVANFTKQKGDFICGECTDLFLYYIENKKTQGVFPNKIITFIEKFYIFPEYRNQHHGEKVLKHLMESLSQLQYNEYIVLSPYPYFDEDYEDNDIEIESEEYNVLKNKIEQLYARNGFNLYKGVPEYEFNFTNGKRKNKVLDLMIHTIKPKVRNPLFYQNLLGIDVTFEPFAAYIYDDQLKKPGFSFAE